jgi:light-regulated signal transduction histidine kinase (bacteriophytochrome)
MYNPDISRTLISSELIKQKLPAIFLDSVVTDNDLMISIVSDNVLELLEFTQEELKGKSLDYLAEHDDLKREIQQWLGSGHFEGKNVCLISKSRRKIDFCMSGFYLGLISDLNGAVVFTLKSVDQAEILKHRLQSQRAEIDKFIYRAGHDLRGPLATIKGLINLLKIRVGDNEVDHLVSMIETHANTLDDRLFQLVYLTHVEVDQAYTELFSPTCIETRLRKIIEKNAFIDLLELHVSASETVITGVNCEMIYALLENLLLYILYLPMTSHHNRIFYRITRGERQLKIVVGAIGFMINDQLINALNVPEFTYTDLVKYPQMINYYTARRRADHLHTSIKVDILSSHKQRIEVIIPFS